MSIIYYTMVLHYILQHDPHSALREARVAVIPFFKADPIRQQCSVADSGRASGRACLKTFNNNKTTRPSRHPARNP